MASNLKKFVNPKFTRTIDLALLRRLFERHDASFTGFSLDVFDEGESEAREAVQEFLAGPEDNYPEGLVADLHRIAELGNSNGLRVLQEQARRLKVLITPEPESGDGEIPRQDPKHVALAIFLDHPSVFDAASDMQALGITTSLGEFAGEAEGIPVQLDDITKMAFEEAAAKLFRADLRGHYCRIGWYEDGNEFSLVVTHGATITTTEVVDEGMEKIISFRAINHAVMAYSSVDGRLKIAGVRKAQQADLAEVFAEALLERPGFFAGADAQLLYTLEPVEARGISFTFNHAYDPVIREVRIVEVQANRVESDPKTGGEHVLWSIMTRDGRNNALFRLGESRRDLQFGPDNWRLSHINIRIRFDIGAGKTSQVTVKLKPPTQAAFKRQRFEGQVMELLRRNGLCHERNSRSSAAAAE